MDWKQKLDKDEKCQPWPKNGASANHDRTCEMGKERKYIGRIISVIPVYEGDGNGVGKE